MKSFYLALWLAALSIAATRFDLHYLGAALAGSALTVSVYGLLELARQPAK